MHPNCWHRCLESACLRAIRGRTTPCICMMFFCDPLHMTNCSLTTGRDGMQRIQPTKIMHTTAPGEIDESVAWHLSCTARSTDAMGSRPGGDRDISRNVFWSGGAGSRQTTNTSTGSPKHTCPRPCPGKSPGIKHTQPKSLPRTANTNDCTRPRHVCLPAPQPSQDARPVSRCTPLG